MKSAYELAMERLQKASPSVTLTDDQKKQIAEVDSQFQAKIAEKELFLKDQIHKVQNAEKFEEVEALEKQSFDVVLMDVQMPEMDGLEATIAIRQREVSTGKHVPIIAITAHAMKGDEARCLAAGMDAYLSKPIQADELFELIDRHLGLSRVTVSRVPLSPQRR